MRRIGKSHLINGCDGLLLKPLGKELKNHPKRVFWGKREKPLPKVDFTGLGVAALLEKLVSPNSYDQERAARTLVERGAEKVLPELDAWTKRQTGSMWCFLCAHEVHHL